MNSKKLLVGAFFSTLALSLALNLAAPSPASAQTFDFDAELEKVDQVTTSLLGIIAAFTTASISPMGISAGVKMFKHVVLANV